MPEINLSHMPGDLVFTATPDAGIVLAAHVKEVRLTTDGADYYLSNGAGPLDGDDLYYSATAAGHALDEMRKK